MFLSKRTNYVATVLSNSSRFVRYHLMIKTMKWGFRTHLLYWVREPDLLFILLFFWLFFCKSVVYQSQKWFLFISLPVVTSSVPSLLFLGQCPACPPTAHLIGWLQPHRCFQAGHMWTGAVVESGSRFLMSKEPPTWSGVGALFLQGAVTAALTDSSRRNLGQNFHTNHWGLNKI